jgi:ATP synthase protein I
MNGPEPERELVRRAAPWAVPAMGVALAIGVLAGDWGTGWSAAIGVGIVALNLVAHGLSLAWAARISPTMIFAVGMGGFVMRLATIAITLVLLNQLDWFSPVGFALAVVPATILLLIYEARILSGRMQVDLWSKAPEARS